MNLMMRHKLNAYKKAVILCLIAGLSLVSLSSFYGLEQINPLKQVQYLNQSNAPCSQQQSQSQTVSCWSKSVNLFSEDTFHFNALLPVLLALLLFSHYRFSVKTGPQRALDKPPKH